MAEESSRTLKRVGIELSLGMLIGVALAGTLGPSAISWWYAPPSKDAFSCASSVETALSQFVILELVSAGGGAIGLWLVIFLLRRMWKRRKAPATVGPT